MFRKSIPGLCRATVLAALVSGGVQQASAEEIVLRAVTYAPPTAYEESILAFKQYVDSVNEAAEGRLKIDYVGGPEVIGVRDQINALRDGIVDMVVTFTAHESLVPEVGTVGLSKLTPAEEREVGYFEIMDEAHAKIGVRPIGRVSTNSGFFIFSRKKLANLEDFKGLRIRSHSGYDAFFEALGAVPIHMQISEIYPALERGLVDAAPYPLFVHSLGIHEVADYAVSDSFWPSHTTFTYVNADKYASLPEDLQALLMEKQIELEAALPDLVQEMQQEERRKLEEAGVEFVPLSDDDREAYRKAADESRWEALKDKIEPEKLERIRGMIAPQS